MWLRTAYRSERTTVSVLVLPASSPTQATTDEPSWHVIVAPTEVVLLPEASEHLIPSVLSPSEVSVTSLRLESGLIVINGYTGLCVALDAITEAEHEAGDDGSQDDCNRDHQDNPDDRRNAAFVHVRDFEAEFSSLFVTRVTPSGPALTHVWKYLVINPRPGFCQLHISCQTSV